MAHLLTDTVVHVDGSTHWLTAGSELPVEFTGLVGEYLLDGSAPAEAEKPKRGGRSGK